jgi:hypothetical protein
MSARALLPEFALADVETVYVGRADGCRCGCLGTYYTVWPEERPKKEAV